MLEASGNAGAGAAACGYAYEMVVEAALRARMPVLAYASELRVRAAAGGGGHHG